MIKFKVGEIVEVINKNGMVASLGATAVVTTANYGFIIYDLIDVVWKTNSNNQIDGGYSSFHFKPAVKKNQQLLFSFMSAAEGT